jgi:hypothetical protein
MSDVIGILQLALMGSSFGLLAAVGYSAWLIVKKAIAFFDDFKHVKDSVATMEKSIVVMNHNSNRLEKALIYAHILSPADFEDDA